MTQLFTELRFSLLGAFLGQQEIEFALWLWGKEKEKKNAVRSKKLKKEGNFQKPYK